MIRVRTDFPFVGSRQYVHASTVLCGFLDLLEQASRSAAATVERFKFLRQADSNGELVLEPVGGGGPTSNEANATFVATAAGRRWRGAFVAQGIPVNRRVEVTYSIDELHARDFAGRCRFEAADRDELVRALIEANKRFHLATVGTAPRAFVRFGYLENWVAPPRWERFRGELIARNLLCHRTADSVLTINRLSYAAADARPLTLTLCFSTLVAAVTP